MLHDISLEVTLKSTCRFGVNAAQQLDCHKWVGMDNPNNLTKSTVEPLANIIRSSRRSVLTSHHNGDPCHPEVFVILDQVAKILLERVFDGESAYERFAFKESFKFAHNDIQAEKRVT